jgi:hypothetical protein
VSALAVPALSVGVALGAGGLAKLRQPSAAIPLLRATGLPATGAAGAALGAIEVLLAVAATAVGGPVAHAFVAVAFAGFAVVLVRVLRHGGATSCGCFGRRSTPPHAIHVGIDATAAVFAGLAALTSTPGLFTGLLDDGGWHAAAILALAVLGGALLIATLTVLPEALTTTRQVPPGVAPEPFHLLTVHPS